MHIEPISVAGQHDYDGLPFPLVLQCQSDDAGRDTMLDWIAANRNKLDQQAEAHGAILFRDFPISSVDDFDAFVTATGFVNFTYEKSLSNAVRVNRTERVFTANEAPAEVTIHLHHEMAQTPVYPSKLFFYCEHPADSGGATPICRSDCLLDRLASEAPRFVEDCKSKALKYTNVMPGAADMASGMGRSWQSTLSAETREEAEHRLDTLGYTLAMARRRLPPGDHARATCRARRCASGRTSFFNQLIAASQGWKDSRNDPSKAITHGDGTPLDQNSVLLAARLAEEFTFDIPWQRGDVALVDNFVTMHGRRTFSGSRKVLASLVASD